MQTEAIESIDLDDITKANWYRIVFDLKKRFGKKPDMNGILFIIGMQEIGIVKNFDKQEKTNILHVATCKLLSQKGYYVFSHTDEDGWPHYNLVNKPPFVDLLGQENLLKTLIVQYFNDNEL